VRNQREIIANCRKLFPLAFFLNFVDKCCFFIIIIFCVCFCLMIVNEEKRLFAIFDNNYLFLLLQYKMHIVS